jgi:hypothetical protein
MKKMLSSILLLMFLAGCGGGGDAGTVGGGDGDQGTVGGGDGDQGTVDWKGTFNAAGFPEVEATYSFVPGEISFSCSNQAQGLISGEAIILELLQWENELWAVNAEAGTEPGTTIIDNSTLSGTIETDGRFAMTQWIIYTYADQDGAISTYTIDYELQGLFTIAGWSGDYRFSIFNDAVTCDYSSRFIGELLANGTHATVHAWSTALPTKQVSVPVWTPLGHRQ